MSTVWIHTATFLALCFQKKSFLFSFYQGCGCHHAHQLTEHNFQLKISFCSTCSLTHKLGRAAGEETFCGKSHVKGSTTNFRIWRSQKPTFLLTGSHLKITWLYYFFHHSQYGFVFKYVYWFCVTFIVLVQGVPWPLAMKDYFLFNF